MASKLEKLIQGMDEEALLKVVPDMIKHMATVEQEHNELREKHQERAATLKQKFIEAGIPVMPSVTHIVPVLVGDPVLCKQASDELLFQHNIYVQPINYPTVPRGTERLRFTPTPLHQDEHMDKLVEAMKQIWTQLGIKAAA